MGESDRGNRSADRVRCAVIAAVYVTERVIGMVNAVEETGVEAVVLRTLRTVGALTRGGALSCVEIRVSARSQGTVIDEPTGQTDRLLRDMVVRGLLEVGRPRSASGSRRARLFWLTAAGQEAAR